MCLSLNLKRRELTMVPVLLITLVGCSFSQDGYFDMLIHYRDIDDTVEEEKCNQLFMSNGILNRIDIRTINIQDITHPCYCILYDENNNLHNLEIDILSYDIKNSWDYWQNLVPSDWNRLDFSIPHFSIEPHPLDTLRLVTYKENQEVSTVIDKQYTLEFLSRDADIPVRANLRCSPTNFPYINTTTSITTTVMYGNSPGKNPGKNFNQYLIIGINVACVLALTSVIIIAVIFFIIRRRKRNFSDQNRLHHVMQEESHRENDDEPMYLTGIDDVDRGNEGHHRYHTTLSE